MKKTDHKLPDFRSIKEMEEFWETHELTEFQDDFKEIHDTKVDIKNRTYLPITLTMYEKLEKIAHAQHTTVDRLIHRWVEEKLNNF